MKPTSPNAMQRRRVCHDTLPPAYLFLVRRQARPNISLRARRPRRRIPSLKSQSNALTEQSLLNQPFLPIRLLASGLRNRADYALLVSEFVRMLHPRRGVTKIM